ncbi:MAG TPA: hypothetical protein VLS92_08360 [Acidimicrobiia bacterium]|nr:hypothetical protein [Acidimicrobiia bacterium]
MDPIKCPNCGGGVVTREMFGWVNPDTGKYVSRFLGFRLDTWGLSLVMFGMGVLYTVWYLVAIPCYLVWRLFTHRRYTVRRHEYICEGCNHHWNEDQPR